MQTQQRVLASAFLRSLKDPFPPSRTAGLNGLAVTSSYYTPQDVANKILPGLCPTLVDPEKTVRDKVLYVDPSLVVSFPTHTYLPKQGYIIYATSSFPLHTIMGFLMHVLVPDASTCLGV